MEMQKFRIGSDNFSYMFIEGKNALIIDPGMDPEEVLEFIESRDLTLRYIVATHHHGDHTMSVPEIARKTGARVVTSDYCAGRIGGADMIVHEGDEIEFGDSYFRIISTPGHTPGGICLLADDLYLLTGDTLFIDDCGRCDLPDSSLEKMFESLQKLKSLPDALQVLPGHDYGRIPTDSLGNQKKTNPTLLAKNLSEFSRM